MFDLPEVPSPKVTRSSVPAVLRHLYNYQEDEEDTHFELDDTLAELTNRIVHHPEVHNYDLGNNVHHLKFNYGLEDHGRAHRTELLVHTELVANNTIVNLYKVLIP